MTGRRLPRNRLSANAPGQRITGGAGNEPQNGDCDERRLSG
jgi:hypothetical protein